jgi:glycosyltransferase involved in cell wall biosynthesis
MNSTIQRVSVIIPAYNVEQSLSVTINSVLRQTFGSFEVLVINDGSTDNTDEVARSYGDNIIYIEQQNQGQGTARNTGLQRASGEFIAFLDADDYWKEGFLEKCVKFMDEHKDAVAVTTGQFVKLVNGKEIIAPPCLQNGTKRSSSITENFFTFWADQDHIRTGTNIIRKSVIDEAGFMRADLRGVSEDLEYWGYIATFGKWGFIPEPLEVSNSQTAAISAGWLNKFKYRRKSIPSIDTWDKRILPRLESKDIPGFKAVRSRIAFFNVHNRILAGDYNKALEIVNKYGGTMPRTRLTLLMRTGARYGRYSWLIACYIVRLKEFIKSWMLASANKTKK